MKIRTSSDWRENLPFDVPMRVADVAPGGPAHCASCPADAALLDREELWAVKHRHPNNPAGFVRFYCAAHTPRAAPRPAAAAQKRPAPRTPRLAKPSVPEREAVMCPDCFVEVPASGTCGMCGQKVA